MYKHTPYKISAAESHTQKLIKSNMLLLELEIHDLKHGMVVAKQEAWSKDSLVLYTELVLETMIEKFKFLSHHTGHEIIYLDKEVKQEEEEDVEIW